MKPCPKCYNRHIGICSEDIKKLLKKKYAKPQNKIIRGATTESSLEPERIGEPLQKGTV